METNICVTIAILYTDYQIANNRHARAITKELLVCRLCIILLSLYELVVEVNVIPPRPLSAAPDNRQLRQCIPACLPC